ncbi:MAG: hypothetical protein IPG42_10790 [Betaproteobacteria bacterium]|nr:hypothetical protein [Betaproteobacteria bacterium]
MADLRSLLEELGEDPDTALEDLMPKVARMNEIPSTWQWSTIGEISAYIQRGKSPKYIDKVICPVINQKCIRWGELQLQHLKYIHPEQFSAWDEARFIKAGDVLWNSTGTGTVGRAYHVKAADCTPSKVVDSHVTILPGSAGIGCTLFVQLD